MSEQVTKDVCTEKHKAIDDKNEVTVVRLNDHSHRIGSVEDAVLKLTIMVESIGKKSIFDKMLVTAVFIIAVVLLAVIIGPETAGKFVGGVVK